MKPYHSGNFSDGADDCVATGSADATDDSTIGVSPSACFFNDSVIERRSSLMSTFDRTKTFGAAGAGAGVEVGADATSSDFIACAAGAVLLTDDAPLVAGATGCDAAAGDDATEADAA